MMPAFGLPEVLRAVSQRRGLITLLTLALFALVTGAVQIMRPIYRADALIEVADPRRGIPGSEAAAAAGGDASMMLATVNTEVSRLDAEPIARVVYDRLGRDYADALRNTGPLAALRDATASLCGRMASPSWVRRQVCDPDPLQAATNDGGRGFAKFHKAFTIEAIRGSRAIRVSAAAPDPNLAATMANTLVNTYIHDKADDTTRQNATFIAWLEGRMAQVAKQATQSSQAVAEYRMANNLIELTSETDALRRSPVTEQLSNLLRDLASAVAAKAQAEVRLAQMRDLKADPQRALSSTEVAGSEVIRDLYRQESAARQRLSEYQVFSDQHPRKLATIAELESIHNRINLQASRVLDAATQDYARASAVVERLSKEVARQQERAAKEQFERVKLGDLERRARIDSDLHAAFLRSTQEAIEHSTWHEPNVRLVAGAISPERPTFPDKRLILPVGFVASLSFASLAGIVLELRRKGQNFVDPADLEDATGLDVKGIIPTVRRPMALPTPRNLVLAVEDIGMRLLFQNMHRPNAAGQAPSRIVAITSSSQGEGKSVLSLAIARWLAGHGAHTLLLNADIRRPSILQRATGTVTAGFINGPTWAPTLPLHLEASSRLMILSLDEVQADPVAIIAGIEEILAPLRQAFRIIVVDLPPALVVPDAFNVVPYVDQTLFVVRWAVTRRRSVLYALDRFNAADRARTGLVFSRVDAKSYRRYELPGAERYGVPHRQGYAALPQMTAAQQAPADLGYRTSQT